MTFSAASVARMSLSRSSVLQMSVLMCLATLSNSVMGAAAVDSVLDSNARQLLLRGSALDGRELESKNPFDFNNNACKEKCVVPEGLTLFDNACPTCPDKYTSEHCNHCCYDGASSLKLRWHGCPGTFVFASSSEGVKDCALEPEDRDANDGIRFIDCTCYDSINTPETFDPSKCPLRESITFTNSHATDSDICIVSVNELDTSDPVIDFSKPLPDVVGLVQNSTWAPSKLRTYFDTTCRIIDNKTKPYVLPLFPGYGKIPNSCPTIGFIDLETTNSSIPVGINHTNGKPSTERYWFEFLDGTSTGFWPNVDAEASATYYFDPTFAECSCINCSPSTPTTTTTTPTPNPGPGPIAPPTPATTPSPTPNLTRLPTPVPFPRPTSTQTASPIPNATQLPTPAPTSAPVSSPTPNPTALPTSNPAPSSTQRPTPNPTLPPTPNPTTRATSPSTALPTPNPPLLPVAFPTT